MFSTLTNQQPCGIYNCILIWMNFVQLDMEVIFYYPDVSMDMVVTDEADNMNDQFNCT